MTKLFNNEKILSSNKDFNIENQIIKLQEIIKKTILAVNQYKIMDVLGSSEFQLCIHSLETIFINLSELLKIIKEPYNENVIINSIKEFTSELSGLFRTFGTNNIDDLFFICLGKDYLSQNMLSKQDCNKLEIMRKYLHPFAYNVISWNNSDNSSSSSKSKSLKKNRIIEDFMIVQQASNLECFDLSRNSKSFQTRVYGLKFAIQNYEEKKTLIISCLVDDIMTDCLNYNYIIDRIADINNNIPNDNEFNNLSFKRYIETLTLKELLVYNNQEIFDRYTGYINQIHLMKQKTIGQVTKEFLANDLYGQRTTLIQLLICSNEHEYQYLSYLLYDLLTNDNNGNIDTQEQTLLFDSLPWNVKKYFRDAMKQTINYTNNLSNFDNNKIPLEQQICLMKVSDTIKEKAMVKLKEIKSKSEDSGSKARQYLDGLLRIPFGIYREEPILNITNENLKMFNDLIQEINNNSNNSNNINLFPFKNKYSSMEMRKYLPLLKSQYYNILKQNFIDNLKHSLINNKRNMLIVNICYINELIKTNNIKYPKLCHSGKNTLYMQQHICNFIDNNVNNLDLLLLIYQKCNINNNNYKLIKQINSSVSIIEQKNLYINNFMDNITEILDNAVHGHEKAKRQIERIIGQWINGEKSGYCFGFEGPPGLGKCLAKDTPIMLSNGKIKMVQDITLEDKLMGDDSTPRNVLALGSGFEKMYRIEQVKGDDYVVNESHILSLKMTKAGKKGDKHQTILGKRYFKNDIVDICIKDYLSLPKYLQECLKGYKVGLDFEEKELDLDPYALGYWLGDGHSSTFAITTIEKSIVDYFKEYAFTNGLQITQGKSEKNMITYYITTGYTGGRSDKNKLLNYLKNHNLINNKHIPEIYKCNSRENRLKLLAGLIDSDGYCDKVYNSLEITQKNKKLADDILFLVRSLGFCGTMRECIKSCMYKGEKKSGQYHRIIISGSGREEIPTLLERKRPREHKQIKDGLNTGIKIIPQEEDQYYGFQIDGNSRFLLGDFTVTHNTSLAKKGISNCLKDENNISRPFSFIAIGGSSNGSTLDGHNYTYVGSTWGRIVDILMEKKCMNPIIFIDELDKVSNTEHGKELIGILTHLIDPTQNDDFQDKYFNGISLDLSKALFIFSYNDVNLIDRILLDRIHRIKFDHLSLEDKLTITKNYLFPEIYKNMGLDGVINISDSVIEYIIEKYTSEPGVRKLKELLFEIVGEINLSILKNNTLDYDIPINITEDDIKYKYLKNKNEIVQYKVHENSQVGLINGLWANALGKGGVLPIEIKYFPSTNMLDLKLTGMQGDVMKESMTVAKTLAWSLLDFETMKVLQKQFDKTKNQGIHIHVPEGATPKDGPSAGTAITVVIYSLLKQKKILSNIAITGEISLQGKVTAIGGLDLKILGGIRAGVKTFIYPKDNNKDFIEFKEKYNNKDILKDIKFIEVNNIHQVLDIVFDDN